MNLYKSLFKNTAILTIGTICTRCITFLMIPFFSRWLSVEDYGTFDLFCIYIAIIVPFCTLSYGEGIFRKIVDADDLKVKQFTSVSVALFFVVFLLFCLVIPLAFYCLDSKMALPFLALASGELFAYLMTNYARGKRKIIHYAISSFILVITMSLFVTLFVYSFKWGLSGILYGYALGFFVEISYLFFSTRIYKDVDFRLINRPVIKELTAYSVPLIPNKISWNLVNVISRTLILFYLGAVSNGVYAIASKIPTICTALFSAFHLSWQESAVDALNETEKNSFFNHVYNKSVVVVLSICIVVLSFNHVLFNYIFDIKYHDAVYISPILISAMLFAFLGQFISGIFNAFEKTKINGSSTLYATILNVVLCVLLIQWIGLYAVAIATLVAYLFLFVYRLIKLKSLVVLKLESKLLFVVLIYFVYLLVQYIDFMPLHCGSILLAVVLFIAFNRTLFKKIFQIIGRIF